MAKLENKIIERLSSEGRISHMPIDEEQKIYLSTQERMNKYKKNLAKREYYSYIIAKNLILNV